MTLFQSIQGNTQPPHPWLGAVVGDDEKIGWTDKIEKISNAALVIFAPLLN